MFSFHRLWPPVLGREGAALLLIAVTTIGWNGDYAFRAVQSSTAKAVSVATSPLTATARGLDDIVFSLRDSLEALRYELGFERDSRNTAALAGLCAATVAEIAELRDHSEVAELVATTHSIVAVCERPAGASDREVEVAIDDALRYRELSFDVAA